MLAKTYRHTAKTDVGTFRTNFVERHYPFAVVYCGWDRLPEATSRRLAEKEGVCYGWARDERDAELMKRRAEGEGCLNVIIHEVAIRELP